MSNQNKRIISEIEKRSFDRLINFTDAVSAIAITLQLLPLIDIKANEGESIWQLLAENSSQLLAFCFSFVVVSVLWLKHNQIFNVMRTFDGTIFWLNTIWMALIVFLPWPAALYGSISTEQSVSNPGAGLLYWWTMAAICAVGWMIAHHAWSHPELLEHAISHDQQRLQNLTNYRGLSFFVAFFLMGCAAELIPQTVPYLSFAVIPLSILNNKAKRYQSSP